ncbi:hypothetical protein ACWDRR_01040, partial [Kitasatospora sp. NPDC003701]
MRGGQHPVLGDPGRRQRCRFRDRCGCDQRLDDGLFLLLRFLLLPLTLGLLFLLALTLRFLLLPLTLGLLFLLALTLSLLPLPLALGLFLLALTLSLLPLP